MHIATRAQIIAAKEKLNKLAEEAREAEERKAAQVAWEEEQEEERAQEQARLVHRQKKAEEEAKREKVRAEMKAREDAEYLKRHNRTVKKVLSQAARNATREDDDEPDESEGADGSSDSGGSDLGIEHQHQQGAASSIPSTSKRTFYYAPIVSPTSYPNRRDNGCHRRQSPILSRLPLAPNKDQISSSRQPEAPVGYR